MIENTLNCCWCFEKIGDKNKVAKKISSNLQDFSKIGDVKIKISPKRLGKKI